MTQRATWDETWDDVAQTVAWRSLCSRSRVGCVITDARHRVVSTGYNGPPAGFEHSDLPCDQWCPRGADVDNVICVSVHAEANALISGDRSSWRGGTMYLTKHPCLECAKMIANSGLARLYVNDEREGMEPKHVEVYRFLQEECGLEVDVVNQPRTAPVVPMRRL